MGLVVAYGRVSDQRQADAGGLERQERQLLEGVTADEILLDVGSGKNTARPQYQRLLELVASGKVDRILIKEQDRLNRNLKADLELWELCQANGTVISDLHGREIEFRTPDGELMSTVVSALNQHRSKSYGLKIRNGLNQARKDQKPARPTSTFPFGYRPVRDDKGKITGVELNPEQAQQARERVDIYLAGNSLSESGRQILASQGADIKPNALSNWLRHPYLRGRLCWGSDNKGNFSDVADQPTFGAIISDVEADLIKARLSDSNFNKGLRGRNRRMLSGICKCSECGYTLSYRIAGDVQYLKCKHRHCKYVGKIIHADRIFAVLQYAMAEHAAAIVPLIDRPQIDPPGVELLQQEIEVLNRVSGTEELVARKRAEIAVLRVTQSKTPQWLLLGAVRSLNFWLEDLATINSALMAMGCDISIQLSEGGVSKAMVKEIRFNTNPAIAPLPDDQRDVLIRKTLADIKFAQQADEQIEAALKSI